MQYRKSIYRRKRIKAVAILSISAAVLLFVLFIIVGTALHKKTSENGTDLPDDTQHGAENTVSLSEAKPIGAYALPLLADGSTFSERLSGLPDDAEAVALSLNGSDGTLYYRSQLSDQFGFLKSADDASSLSSSVSRIKDRDLYASGILYVPSFSVESDISKEIYLTSWCSVAVEAVRAGIDDCLLVPRAAGTDDIDKLCAMASLIRENEPEAIVGLLVPDDVIFASNGEALVDKLSKSFNYLALDASNAKEGEDVGAYVEARISQMQLQIIYYKMRVLLPSVKDAALQQEYVDIAKKYNVTGWQCLP